MDGAGGATPLASAAQTGSERLLEETLVNNPDMLMPGLTLVGRQTSTEGGALDLLGVDRDGRLALFELKRGTLSRDAVAQVIDYASYLEAMDDETLARHIADYSGRHGIDNIDDFAEWYSENRSGQELSEMRPMRLFLVGLGVDDTTTRMVRFLAKGRIDISLLTFLGFNHDGKILLARQMQVEPSTEPSQPNQPSERELQEQLRIRIQEQTDLWEEAQLLWNAAEQMFRDNFHNASERASRTGRRAMNISPASPSAWGWYRLNFMLNPPNRRSARFGAVQLAPWNRTLEVIFFPRAVELCLEDFQQLRREIPFHTWPANDPGKDDGVLEIKFVIKAMSDWEKHKDKLAAVTRSIYEAVYTVEDE